MTTLIGNRKLIVILAVAALAAALFAPDASAQGAPPPFPFIYKGTAETVDGAAVPDGLQIVAVIDDYKSEPVDVVWTGSTRTSRSPPVRMTTSTCPSRSSCGTWRRSRPRTSRGPDSRSSRRST